MQSYFSAIQPHLEDRVDIALVRTRQSSSSRAVVSLGIDNLIYTRNLVSQQQNRIYLPEGSSYSCIAESTNTNNCILGSQTGSVEEFNLQSQQTRIIYKSQYKIHSLTNSPSRRYLAVASQESKCILVDLQTLNSSKCRPGHELGVASAVFSEDEKYLASIGLDKTLFIYGVENFNQPAEKFHIKICKSDQQDGSLLRGCFHKILQIFYAPGMRELQIVQLLNNKWEYRMAKFIRHNTQLIQLVKILKTSLMVTCSANQFFIWNNKIEEKLIVLEDFTLSKIIEVNESFWGCKNDGRIFGYKKILTQSIGGDPNQQAPLKMELQNDHANQKNNPNTDDVLNFDDEADEVADQEEEEQKQKSVMSEVSYKLQKQKKSKADRLITAFPQESLSTRTSQFDNAYYLRTSHQGYLILRNEGQYERRVQFQTEGKLTSELLFINKDIKYCDFNSHFVVYGNDNTYGLKFLKSADNSYFDTNESWEKHWEDITYVACSYHWVAIANDQEIKLLDLTGNQFKTIAFDRLIVAVAAYENLLAVVYHQSIPIDGSQCLAMQLYVVNHETTETLKCSACHVPVKPKATLKFFRFSNEAMLLTHDDHGYIKVYNLEDSTWTSVFVQGVQDNRRIWLLGMQNFQLIYWKTSQLNPDPQVFPRLPIKTSRLGTNVAIDDPIRMYQYPFLMFQRFCLNHEKFRSRFWYRVKHARNQKYPGYKQNIAKILTLNEIAQHHNQLDYKFFDFIKFYLENPKTHLKAVQSVKTLIKTIQAGKRFIDIFDNIKQRGLAVDLEIYFQELEKQLEYETMQNLELENLKIEAEKSIKPKVQNNPFNRKKTNNEYIPSLNNSQLSQASNFDSLSQRSTFKGAKQNGMKMANKPPILQTPVKEEVLNPFLKKKSTQDDLHLKAKQIDQQIEKHGIKKKAQIPKRLNNKM